MPSPSLNKVNIESIDQCQDNREMSPQLFTFKGKEIKQEILKRIWKAIRLNLRDKYPVEDISMPKIEAISLTHRRFRKAMKQLETSPHFMDTSGIEWGEEVGFPSACAFPSDVDQKWIVLVCRGLRPLEQDLKHELLHIWESTLVLKWGTLTQRMEGSDK